MTHQVTTEAVCELEAAGQDQASGRLLQHRCQRPDSTLKLGQY